MGLRKFWLTGGRTRVYCTYSTVQYSYSVLVRALLRKQAPMTRALIVYKEYVSVAFLEYSCLDANIHLRFRMTLSKFEMVRTRCNRVYLSFYVFEIEWVMCWRSQRLIGFFILYSPNIGLHICCGNEGGDDASPHACFGVNPDMIQANVDALAFDGNNRVSKKCFLQNDE